MEYKSMNNPQKQNNKYVQLGNKFYTTASDNIDGITNSEVCWRKHYNQGSLCFRELGLTPARFLIELWQAADSNTTTPFEAAEFGLELRALSKHRTYHKPPSLLDAKFACLEFRYNSTINIPFWYGKEIHVDIGNIQHKMDIEHCCYDTMNGENAMQTLLERLTRKAYFRDNVSLNIVSARTRWIVNVDKRCKMTGKKSFVFLPYACRPRNFTNVMKTRKRKNIAVEKPIDVPAFLLYEDISTHFSMTKEESLVIQQSMENIHSLQDQLLAASNSFLRKR
jgi:hypothetical protein